MPTSEKEVPQPYREELLRAIDLLLTVAVVRDGSEKRFDEALSVLKSQAGGLMKSSIIKIPCSGWDHNRKICKHGHGNGVDGFAGHGPICFGGFDAPISNKKLLTPPCVAIENE